MGSGMAHVRRYRKRQPRQRTERLRASGMAREEFASHLTDVWMPQVIEDVQRLLPRSRRRTTVPGGIATVAKVAERLGAHVTRACRLEQVRGPLIAIGSPELVPKPSVDISKAV
jgi:hypothetical protein